MRNGDQSERSELRKKLCGLAISGIVVGLWL